MERRTLDSQQLQQLLPEVIKIARLAGDEILKVYAGDFEVISKADDSPVTQADLKADGVILPRLIALTPNIPVVTEETKDNLNNEERMSWDIYWVVDPLDGTKEFVERNGHFTVNIALIMNHRPVLGVVYVPVSGVTYYASSGNGAFIDRPGNKVLPLKVRACRKEIVTVVASRAHNGPELKHFLSKLPKYEILNIGSAIKFGLVAEGLADVYHRFGSTWEWDDAAGHCVLEEAGGTVRNRGNQPLLYGKETLMNDHFIAYGDSSIDWFSFTK